MNAPIQERIGIDAYACMTALGDAAESCKRLANDEVALAKTPTLGKNGGDPVPLAVIGDYEDTFPPRWEARLEELAANLPAYPWGSARYPVFVTSSNYDVGSLYVFGTTKDESFTQIGPPARTLAHLKRLFSWGENTIALSHACVTANLGIEMASRHLDLGLADKALVFSFDFVSPFVAGGFNALKILNADFPAPYQDKYIGSIGLGDGAAYFVLSKSESPFSVVSNFLYNEMYHFTANEPNGSGFAEGAHWLEKNSVSSKKVWIKGHGTGTLEAGKLEATAFNEILPNAPLVSWKGSLGHTLGSCGAVELAIAIEAFKQGTIPGTVGTNEPTFAPNVATKSFSAEPYDTAALFSNAFGGAHAACLLRYDR